MVVWNVSMGGPKTGQRPLSTCPCTSPHVASRRLTSPHVASRRLLSPHVASRRLTCNASNTCLTFKSSRFAHGGPGRCTARSVLPRTGLSNRLFPNTYSGPGSARPTTWLMVERSRSVASSNSSPPLVASVLDTNRLVIANRTASLFSRMVARRLAHKGPFQRCYAGVEQIIEPRL